MKVLIILSIIFLVGCEDYPQYRTITKLNFACTDEVTDKRASFTLECIKGANPKSDEEPEDWIRICKSMATETYCKREAVKVNQVRYNSSVWWEDMEVVK